MDILSASGAGDPGSNPGGPTRKQTFAGQKFDQKLVILFEWPVLVGFVLVVGLYVGFMSKGHFNGFDFNLRSKGALKKPNLLKAAFVE